MVNTWVFKPTKKKVDRDEVLSVQATVVYWQVFLQKMCNFNFSSAKQLVFRASCLLKSQTLSADSKSSRGSWTTVRHRLGQLNQFLPISWLQSSASPLENLNARLMHGHAHAHFFRMFRTPMSHQWKQTTASKHFCHGYVFLTQWNDCMGVIFSLTMTHGCHHRPCHWLVFYLMWIVFFHSFFFHRLDQIEQRTKLRPVLPPHSQILSRGEMESQHWLGWPQGQGRPEELRCADLPPCPVTLAPAAFSTVWSGNTVNHDKVKSRYKYNIVWVLGFGLLRLTDQRSQLGRTLCLESCCSAAPRCLFNTHTQKWH